MDKLRATPTSPLPWMVATDNSLKWPYNMRVVHPISAAFDAMTGNWFLLDQGTKDKTLQNKAQIQKFTELLQKLGKTGAMLDDTEKLEDVMSRMIEEEIQENPGLAAMLAGMVAAIAKRPEDEGDNPDLE